MISKITLLKRTLSFVVSLTILFTSGLFKTNINMMAVDYEYAMFPGSTLKVTQGAFNEYNAFSHSKQNAFDLGGNNNYAAPFSGTITKIYKDFNAVVLQSDDKVYWANGVLDYMSVCFVHDNDISNLSVGTHLKQGEVFYQPGVKDPNGTTTGTHLHLCVNKGKTNAAIPYFSGDTRPNEALYITDDTVVKQTGNYKWTIKKDATLSSITINPDSIGTMYEDGSSFNSQGLTLTATYSDGSTKTITNGYTISDINLSTVGKEVLTVSYEGKTAIANITVQDLFKGNGTAESPYLVNNASDLKMVADMTNNVAANACYGNAYYKQTADIDLSEYTNWTPIGIYLDRNTFFNGSYDGAYHRISNLNVNYENIYAGLFGRINYTSTTNAVVKNLSINGSVAGTKDCTGGIVGEVGYGATIENCDFTGTVGGLNLVGGITGKIQCGGTISNCYANVEVTATEGNAGGIVGGILVGASEYSTDATISNSYFVGKVSGKGIGGICGLQTIQTTKDCIVTYTNNYYLNSAATGGVAGVAQAGCTGLISSQLKTIATDLGNPYVDNADDSLNNGYPVFEWQIETSDERMSGDANNDGTIDLKDVVIIRRYVAGGWDVELNPEDSDVNNDDEVDLKDVVLIRRYIAGGWDVELA